MFELDVKTQIKRIPQQERSQARFEAVLATAMQLFAARGYESVSMREIAREARMPIATVYQYFPMKLAIVREMWSRYTGTITETLAAGIPSFSQGNAKGLDRLIGSVVDRMAELQSANPAFIEIWSCVAASMELRELDVEDTLHNARTVAAGLRKMCPHADSGVVFDRALVVVEAASATTRLALSLPEPHRARLLLSLKKTIPLLLDPATLGGAEPALSKRKGRAAKPGKAKPKSRKPLKSVSAASLQKGRP
ncbi:MAG: TetR family transcriptional regulator [Terracidiphilus sp.]